MHVHINTRFPLFLCVAATAFLIVMSFILHKTNTEWKPVPLDMPVISAAEANVVWEQKLDETNESWLINGAGYRKGQPVLRSDTWVILFDSPSGRYMRIPTATNYRDDITQKEADRVNYRGSGYLCRIQKKLLEPGIDYGVYLLYRDGKTDTLIDTGKTVRK